MKKLICSACVMVITLLALEQLAATARAPAFGNPACGASFGGPGEYDENGQPILYRHTPINPAFDEVQAWPSLSSTEDAIPFEDANGSAAQRGTIFDETSAEMTQDGELTEPDEPTAFEGTGVCSTQSQKPSQFRYATAY
ncbi:hypothetical protein FACS189472_01150 [Alphaproteobacteria bacterium]|nr:hypothetical protein FACS189472_01150 [Alphaproteobacteria bacterium]